MRKLMFVAFGAYVLRWVQKRLLGRQQVKHTGPERRTGAGTYAGLERRSGR